MNHLIIARPIRRSTIMGVVLALLLIGAAGAGTPASATTPERVAPAQQTAAFRPWAGTVQVEWSFENDYCDGCVSDIHLDRGTLTYTIVAGGQSANPSLGVYRVLAEGSGSIYTNTTDEWGSSTCTTSWSISAFEGEVVFLGNTNLDVGVPLLNVPSTSAGDGCFGGNDIAVVGVVPGLGFDYTVPDNDPDPNRWTGTRTLTGIDPDGEINSEMRSYTFAITVDLSRSSSTGSPPGPPTIKEAKSGRKGGATSAAASWAAPNPDGSAPLTSYKLQAQKVNDKGRVVKRTTVEMAPTKTRTSMKLPSGRYKFRVAAVNEAGTSSWSTSSNIVRAR